MIRIEIISNKSVQEDIEKAMEGNIENFYYTTIPLVLGRGEESRKLGTATWPETNFAMISYIEDKDYETAKKVIAAIKDKFSGEGIKMFAVKAEV